MRPLARQSARWSQHLRSTARARSPATHQRRAFSVSVRRHSESRPPNGAPEHHRQHVEENAEQRTGKDVAKPSQTIEAENGEAKTQSEGRKPGLRKTLRQRRQTDVPKPPPLPQWFLDHNVKLRVEDTTAFEAAGRKQLRCIDAETGHTLFHVPYYDHDLKDDPMHYLSSGKDVDHKDDQQTSAEEPVAEAGDTLGDIQRKLYEKYKMNKAAMRQASMERQSEPVERSGKKKVDSNFFGHRFTSDKPSSSAPGREPSAHIQPVPDTSRRLSDSLHPAFLEIESSARAALSLARQNRPSASFAADRVDISLVCPESKAREHMDGFVDDLASILHANVMRLDANDFANLTDEYVGAGNDAPGSFATLGYDVFDGLNTTGFGRGSKFGEQPFDEAEEDEMDEDEEEEDDHRPNQGIELGSFGSMDELRKKLMERRHDLAKALGGKVAAFSIGMGPGFSMGSPGSESGGPQRMWQGRRADRATPSDYVQWDDARLGALLESLLGAPKVKNESGSQPLRLWSLLKPTSTKEPPAVTGENTSPAHAFQQNMRALRTNPGFWLPIAANYTIAPFAMANKEAAQAKPLYNSEEVDESVTYSNIVMNTQRQRTLIHVRDLKEIRRSRLGDAIVKRLVRVVQKRRRSGKEVLVVGTSAESVYGPLESALDESEDSPFRSVIVPPFFAITPADYNNFESTIPPAPKKALDGLANARILEINARHIESMLKRLQPECSESSDASPMPLDLPGTHILGEKVLSFDQVQRLVLTAIGLSQLHAKSDMVRPVHFALAAHILSLADHAAQSTFDFKNRTNVAQLKFDRERKDKADAAGDAESGKARIERIKQDCNQHETRLLTGVVDPNNIKTAFADVHAAPDTIEALKTLTTLSLLRPDAFKYGVLANDRLPGLLLYGPPGTGKTLLAKAVAKESKATVLEVSGAQIYEKYVGEGEKMVRAVFSLAKKLSPCIVFIDEADAIFGSRSNAGNRNTHREIINQFLREWDGMDDHGVFMMVASNRPFDLDDAVLRRLPRRLLVDLPRVEDREAILGIHLKHESLQSSVSLAKLAEQTPLYSGSDLKNLAVAAALAAVREENDLVTQHKDDKEFKLPEKRTLTLKHFEKAMAEISASISEDMSSLTAIRKFDEQYGDRRGRRKKAGYGFGLGDVAVDEGAARVRQGTTPPPP